MLVNIWVKDTFNGNIHQVGTDVHDSLELCDGAVHYINMQCCEGTYGGAYEFVEAPDIDDYVSVTPEQLMLNRELIHKDVMKAIETKGEAELREKENGKVKEMECGDNGKNDTEF